MRHTKEDWKAIWKEFKSLRGPTRYHDELGNPYPKNNMSDDGKRATIFFLGLLIVGILIASIIKY